MSDEKKPVKNKWYQSSLRNWVVGTAVGGAAIGMGGRVLLDIDRENAAKAVLAAVGKDDARALIKALRGYDFKDIGRESFSGQALIVVLKDKTLSSKERMDMLETLLAKGADVNNKAAYEPWFRSQPLFIAVDENNQPAVDRFLAEEVSQNGKDYALKLAAERGQVGMVEKFLVAGVSQDGKELALRFAVRDGQVETVEKLLTAGVSQDTKDYSLGMVTNFPDKKTHAKIVEVLLAAGVSEKAKNSALKYMTGRHPPEQLATIVKIIEDLLAAGARDTDALVTAASRGHVEMVEKFVAAGMSQKELNDALAKAKETKEWNKNLVAGTDIEKWKKNIFYMGGNDHLIKNFQEAADPVRIKKLDQTITLLEEAIEQEKKAPGHAEKEQSRRTGAKQEPGVREP